MDSLSVETRIQRHIPVVGDTRTKSSVAYLLTRTLARGVNWAQMRVGEAYVHGWDVPDPILQYLVKTGMTPLLQFFPSLLVPYEWVLDESETVAAGAQDLMKVQYDRPQAMFSHMLGDGELIYPKYSMALWEKGAATLEQAQIQMMDDLIAKLEIQDGDRVLDIGCGWGCLAHYLLSKFPQLQVTGLNLSHQQCEYMRQKMQDPKSFLSSGRFTLVEADLNVVEFPEPFDKIVSVGLFEHVGNMTHGLRKVASFLKPGGQFFLHIITVRTPNNASSVYTHKYIFPHGRYWSFDTIPTFNQDLRTVKRWYLNGMNYHKTFRQWLDNFDASYDVIKDLDYGIDFETFRRIWRFYLIFLGTCFACCDGEINGNGQFLLTHC